MFCSNCGQPNINQINPTVSKCFSCGYEFFANPKATVTIVVICEDQVLLIQRKNNPFAGSWSFVGGFLDYGENSKEAAVRELKEEIRLDLDPRLLVFLNNSSHDYCYQDQTFSVNTNAYLVKITPEIAQKIVVGDDAGDHKWVNKTNFLTLELPFSNKVIAQKTAEYLDWTIDLTNYPQPEHDLDIIRQKIDITDTKILNLFARRFELVKKIAYYKKTNNITALQPNRWQEVLQNRQEIATKLGINPVFIINVWEILHTEALYLENQILISGDQS